jgi:flagellar basal-body rod protein FlgB
MPLFLNRFHPIFSNSPLEKEIGIQIAIYRASFVNHIFRIRIQRMSDLFSLDQTVKVLEKSLDISARRHRMITNNLANMDTIGFRPTDLDFRKTLEQAVENRAGKLLRTHPKHLPHRLNSVLKGSEREPDAHATGLDPVDIDTEMTNLVENNLKYRTSVEMLLRKMGFLKHTIAEGGR